MSAQLLVRSGHVRLCLRLGIHLHEPGLEVRELIEVGSGDLRRHNDVNVGRIRHRIAGPCSSSTSIPAVTARGRRGSTQSTPIRLHAALASSRVKRAREVMPSTLNASTPTAWDGAVHGAFWPGPHDLGPGEGPRLGKHRKHRQKRGTGVAPTAPGVRCNCQAPLDVAAATLKTANVLVRLGSTEDG
jgi:hypothetical protein